jgi:hypothetical protein
MSNDSTKRLTTILAIVMIIAIGGGTILQLFVNNDASIVPTVAAPTDAPTPTYPPPITDLSTISLSGSYLHPSGLFSVAQPTGWIPGSPVTNANGAEITMNNVNQLSVIQDSLQISTEPITNLDQLDALYTTATLNESWSNYRRDPQTGLNYRETGRRREGDQLILDFELTTSRQQTFLARQVAWTDGQWVYSVRVVAPENAVDLLRYLIDNIIPTFKANKVFVGTPTDWLSYFDPTYNLIIRYPGTWQLTDSAPGRPATINGENGTVLRVEAQPGQAAADEAAARAWLENSRPGATVLSVEPTTRGDLSGFTVAYSFIDADGTPFSGLAVLLNGPEALYVANLRFAASNADLNADDAAAGQYSNLLQVANTFQTLTGVSILLPTPTPTNTPLPTLPPTETPLATATLPPTETPVPTNTPEPTATLTATNTPRPTNTPRATATDEPTATNTPRATATDEPPPTATRRPTNTPRPTATP